MTLRVQLETSVATRSMVTGMFIQVPIAMPVQLFQELGSLVR